MDTHYNLTLLDILLTFQRYVHTHTDKAKGRTTRFPHHFRHHQKALHLIISAVPWQISRISRCKACTVWQWDSAVTETTRIHCNPSGSKMKDDQDSGRYLVGGLVAIFYFPISWVANHPNWLSYFSEGWLNHQPDMIWCIFFDVLRWGTPRIIQHETILRHWNRWFLGIPHFRKPPYLCVYIYI